MGSIHLHIFLNDLFIVGLRHFVDVDQCRLQIDQRRKAEVSLCQIHYARPPRKAIYIPKQRLVDRLQGYKLPRFQLVQCASFKKLNPFFLADALLLAGILGETDNAFLRAMLLSPLKSL